MPLHIYATKGARREVKRNSLGQRRRDLAKQATRQFRGDDYDDDDDVGGKRRGRHRAHARDEKLHPS